MQQRRSTLGRPSGTDGSDFSYRMVVDPRYTKVAQGKSRLSSLILIEAIIQAIGVVCIFLFVPKEKSFNRLAVLSINIGFFSLLIGELGRRRSQVNFLRLYMVASSMGTLFSIACIARSGISLEVFRDPKSWATKKFELIEAGRVVLSILLQILAISTTVSLIRNMSPPRRTS